MGCKTKVRSLAWASNFVRPHYTLKLDMVQLNVPKLSSFPRQNWPPQFCNNFTENSVHNSAPAVEGCSWIPEMAWIYGFLVWSQLAGHFKPPTKFAGVGVASHTRPSNTTLQSLWTCSNKARVMGSNLHVNSRTKYTYTQTHKHIYKILLSCKVQNDKVA